MAETTSMISVSFQVHGGQSIVRGLRRRVRKQRRGSSVAVSVGQPTGQVFAAYTWEDTGEACVQR